MGLEGLKLSAVIYAKNVQISELMLEQTEAKSVRSLLKGICHLKCVIPRSNFVCRHT